MIALFFGNHTKTNYMCPLRYFSGEDKRGKPLVSVSFLCPVPSICAPVSLIIHLYSIINFPIGCIEMYLMNDCKTALSRNQIEHSNIILFEAFTPSALSPYTVRIHRTANDQSINDHAGDGWRQVQLKWVVKYKSNKLT